MVEAKQLSDSDDPALPGRYAIVTIAVVAVALATGGVWYQHRLQRRPLAHWGTDTAKLLLRASHVEALQLAPAERALASAELDERLAIGGREWAVVGRRDVSSAPGFSHVRRALVTDGSFGWEDAPSDCQPNWSHALRFTEGRRVATVFFCFDCQFARQAEGEPISIAPVAPAFEAFLSEQFPQ